jgi:hypothetical protein
MHEDSIVLGVGDLVLTVPASAPTCLSGFLLRYWWEPKLRCAATIYKLKRSGIYVNTLEHSLEEFYSLQRKTRKRGKRLSNASLFAMNRRHINFSCPSPKLSLGTF